MRTDDYTVVKVGQLVFRNMQEFVQKHTSGWLVTQQSKLGCNSSLRTIVRAEEGGPSNSPLLPVLCL